MVLRLVAASVLVAFCVTAHAVGVTVAVRWLARGVTGDVDVLLA